MIISNPPYVTESEKLLMKPNVLEYEPHTALFVPDNDPLVFYRCIQDFAKSRLVNGGTVWLEINEAFGKEVLSLFDENWFTERELLKDMFGKYRFVKVTK
jgi:release factor glutamine methyltransferase